MLFQAHEIKRERLVKPYEVQLTDYRATPHFERVENFRVTYKCKSCGYEWTDVDEKTLHDHLGFNKGS